MESERREFGDYCNQLAYQNDHEEIKIDLQAAALDDALKELAEKKKELAERNRNNVTLIEDCQKAEDELDNFLRQKKAASRVRVRVGFRVSEKGDS